MPRSRPQNSEGPAVVGVDPAARGLSDAVPTGVPVISHRFNATQGAVRDTLACAVAALSGNSDIGPEEIGAIELVLAEALNNVVEHAYAGQNDGQISLNITRADTMVWLDIRDRGIGLPGESVPATQRINLDLPREDLPEGGFGWYLIQRLAQTVEYRRSSTENHLVLGLDLTALG